MTEALVKHKHCILCNSNDHLALDCIYYKIAIVETIQEIQKRLNEPKEELQPGARI